jgi:uncharacterized protein (DUF2141 family)
MDRRVFGVVAVAVAALGAAESVRALAAVQQTGTQGRGQGAATGASAATPQSPVRDTNAQPTTGTADISGSVMLEGANAPVRRGQVTLSSQAIRSSRTLITDDKGHFDFTALPAGRYTLTVSKPGYVTTSYGAKKPGRAGTPIQLADTQRFDSANLVMPKGSVITGTVIDEGNEPTPGTQVRAYQYVIRTGEKTLQQAGSASTDDRGAYRIYGLQPGDYLVSVTPRSPNANDMRQALMSQIDQLLQQAQVAGAQQGPGGGPGGGGRGGGGGNVGLGNLGRAAQQPGGRGQQLVDEATALQQQLAQQEKEPTVGYAPVYYPGTTNSASAVPVTLSVGEERAGVDMQLVQVPTAIVSGTLTAPGGTLPQGTQLMLLPITTPGSPLVPGLAEQGARVLANGTFAFTNVAPGQYTVSARAMLRESDPTQANANANANAQTNQAGGRGARGFAVGGGGRGTPGIVTSVLWASADITVNGQNISNLNLALAAGMTVTGHVEFRGTTSTPPSDLTRVRVNITSQDPQTQQNFGGNIPPGTVDATGNFTIPGVPPGHYVLRGNAPVGNTGGGRGGGGTAVTVTNGGGWSLKTAVVEGRDSLDFPFEVRPGAEVSNAVLTFGDKTQTLRGTLQDSSGRPTADYTIIVFAADKTYWTPQSRRITSSRPGTDGTYSVTSLPPGDYRIAAVTDVEQGEWYDPNFLTQLLPASTLVSLKEGDTKTQDLKLAGGGAPSVLASGPSTAR